jgi:hypothetical protein
MSTSWHLHLSNRLKTFLVVISVAIFCFMFMPLAPGGDAAVATPPAYEPATFDLFSIFPQQMLAPAAGKTFTWIPVETRNIADVTEWTWLSTNSESPYFSAFIIPPLVRPSGAEGKAKSFVLVSCAPGTPEGTTGYIKVTGIRGSEQHRMWLKVTALSSEPVLKRGTGDLLGGQGYKDPVLQAYTGTPLTWNVTAENHGGAQDTYDLGYTCSHPCQVRFLNLSGTEISEVAVAGLTHNYLYPPTNNFVVEVTPQPGLAKNQPVDFTVTMGSGANTATTAELPLQVVNPGMLFNINDLAGLKPHVHEAMAGETTSFLFHVTNLESTAADISLAPSGDTGDWSVGLDTTSIVSLPPGETAMATLTATPPTDAATGDRVDLTVTATSSLESEEAVSVAAEVTDVRNIYYFSIDSMDPDYLYLNRAGTENGSEGDWLMPNIRGFMDDAVNYTDAWVYLPSATDMNHTNALAGTYTGTQGLYMVGGTYQGFTEYDEVIAVPNSMDFMLYGPSGEPIKRVYEVAKDETGDKSLGGFWSNKNWLADIEGEKTVDIVGHSERFPLFFPSPYKYSAAGDPQTDENPWDPMSGPFSACFYTDTTREIIIPTLLGQFNLLLGLGLYVLPVSMFVGLSPGTHCEDRYLTDSFFRSILEEDPDVCYINAADLDNTGHFTGGSWDLDEWDTKGTAGAWDDDSMYSPWMRRDECLDIAREVDVLFQDFVNLLKARGTYDNSIIVILSDHGMENMKDQASGYEVLDLRRILRAQGLLHHEDYKEAGGTEINFIWCDDEDKLGAIEDILESYTVEDPELGPVQPLMVINREEMLNGADYGAFGKVRPMELYSEYWINNPDVPDGPLWPDLFIFPFYNYNVAAHGHILAGAVNPVGITLGNIPDNVELGFPGAHGGLQTARMPLIFKAPAGDPDYTPGSSVDDEVEVGEIAPAIYDIMGWTFPGCVDCDPLPPPPSP